MMMCRSLLWVVACILVFSTCKPSKEAASAHKSLENFAAGKRIRDNQCVVDPSKTVAADKIPLAKTVRFDPESDFKGREANLKKILLESLATIPERVQIAYADKLKGYIYLTTDIAKHCGSLFGMPGERTFLGLDNALPPGCYRTEAVPGGHRLSIYVRDDEGALRYVAVRLFGYVVGRLFPHLTPLPDGTYLISENPRHLDEDGFKKLVDFKNGLAKSFLYDVKQKNIFRLENMERFLGADSTKTLRDNLAAMEKSANKDYDIWQNLSFKLPGDSASPTAEQRQYRQDFFMDYVFAEAFDSYYCNNWAAYDSAKIKTLSSAREEPMEGAELESFIKLTQNTKSFMRDVFPTTYNLFLPVHQLLSGLPVTAVADADTKTSFSLNFDLSTLLSLFMNPGAFQFMGGQMSSLLSGLGSIGSLSGGPPNSGGGGLANGLSGVTPDFSDGGGGGGGCAPGSG